MGKASPEKTQSKVIRENQQRIDDLYALINNKRQPPTLSVPPFFGTSNPGLGKFLHTDGGAMFGPIAYNNALVVISNGHLDIRGSTAQQIDERDDTSYVLATGQGTPDDLNFIDGAKFEGQILVLQGTAAQVLNIIHAQLPNISNIVGDGSTNIVTVTTAVNHNLLTGARVNILSTTNFNAPDKPITVTSPTIFTYDLGGIGNATPETSGLVQDGNILTTDGTTFIMDNTIATNVLSVVTLIFDVIPSGGGAWRIISATSSGAVSGPEFPDNLFRIFDDIDNTRKAAFQTGGITTATTRTFTFQDSDGTLMHIDGTGTQVVVKPTDIRDSIFNIVDDVDATKKLQFSLASMFTGSTSIIGSNTLTTGRTWSFPDITGTVIMNSGVQSFTGNKSFSSATLDMNGNDLVLDPDADSKFVTSVDDVLTLNLSATPHYVWNTSGYDIATKYYQLSEIAVPGAPGSTAGRIFLDSADNTLKIRKSSGTISLEGAVADPIILSENDEGNAAATITIDWDDNNYQRMTITQDTAITLASFPVTGKSEPQILTVTMNGTGGFAVTFTNTFENGFTPLVDTTPNGVTTFAFYNYDVGNNILGFNAAQVFVIEKELGDQTVGTTLPAASSSVPIKTFRMPQAMTLINIKASLTVAGTTSDVEIDVKDGSTSVFSTLLTLSPGVKSSEVATTPAVITTATLGDDNEINVFLTKIDSGATGENLKLTIVGFF